MDGTINSPPNWKVGSMTPKQPDRLQSDVNRTQFLDGLRDILEGLRNDPVGGQFVRRFEEIQSIIRREEEGTYTGLAPMLAIRRELERIGTWTRVQDLAQELNRRDVQAPATRNASHKATQRRALTNAERLVRIALQGVNHGRLLGYKKDEAGMAVTYVGMVGWAFPPKVQIIEAKRKGRKSK